MRLSVGVTGATGAPFGVRLLELLRDLPEVETHLVHVAVGARDDRDWRRRTRRARWRGSRTWRHGSGDQAASIASGSFRADGMIIAPCSMKTLAGIRTGYADGLVGRAADVVLKERRQAWSWCQRETPPSEIHLENMLALTRMGAVMVPPMPDLLQRDPQCDRRHRRPRRDARPRPVRGSRPPPTPHAGRAYPTATGGPGRPSGRPGMRREPSRRIPRPSGPEHLISTSWMR